MNQVLDYFSRKEKPELILCNPSFAPIASLGASYNVISTLRFNAISDLEFDFPKSTDNGLSEIPSYSKIQVKMVVKVENVGYYIISECPENSSGETPVKHVTARSIESELLYKRVTALSGTFKFYDPILLADTLMGRVLKLAPGWGVGYIDPELAEMYRTFDVGDNTVYNFLITDVEQAYSCIFTFDALSKVIHAKLIKNLADNIGAYFSFDNISQSMSLTEYSDEIVTAMACYGGTELDIHRVNPLGGNIIYNFDYYINSENDWMAQDLKDALITWKYKTLNKSLEYVQGTLAQNLVVEKLVTVRQTAVEMESVLSALELEHEGMLAAPAGKFTPEEIASKVAEIANQRIAIRTARRQKADYKAEMDAYSASLRILTSSLKFTGEESWQNFCEDIASMLERMQTVSSNWKTVYYETADILELSGAQLIASTPGIETAISRAKDSLETLLILASEKQLSYWTLSQADIDNVISHIRWSVDYIEVVYGLLNSLISNTDMVIDLHSEMAQLESYASIVGQESNLTREQFANLQNFIFDNTYTNNNLITTDLMTEKDVQEVSQELYNQAVDVLARASTPRYEFSGDFINILTLPEYYDVVSRLDLGKQVTIEMAGGEVLDDVALLEISYNYEDPTSSTMVFSNRVKLNTSNWKFADLFIGSGGGSSGVSGITGGGGSTEKAGAITNPQSLTGTNLLSVSNALISKLGYVSFGPTPPTKYGNYVGSWLGYDVGAKFSLYSSANDYLQWDGSKLLIKARNFTLDSYGNITANNATLAGTITAQNGAIGGWNVEETSLYSDNSDFTLNSAIPALLMGDASGSMTGNGVYIGGGSGSYVFRVGDPLGDYLAWDKGGISIAGTWIAGWRISPTSLESGTGSNIVGISSASIIILNDGNGQGFDFQRPAFWAGNPHPETFGSESGSGALFQVWHDGRLFATEATISGSITANSGDIGGWNVTDNTIIDDSGKVGLSSANIGLYDTRFWAGSTNINSAPFRVDEQGNVFASSGSIGGWKILDTALQSESGQVGMSTETTLGDDVRFWAGSQGKESSPFYVTKGGSLHAVKGDIAGWKLTSSCMVSADGDVGMNTSGSIGSSARFWAGSANPYTSPFAVNQDGSLRSTKGTVGGWVISASTLTAHAGEVGITDGDYSFYAGAESKNPADGDFFVTQAGHLFAREAEISGSVTATSGSIGGWGITNTAIEKGGISLNSVASRITVGDVDKSIGVIIDGNGGYLSSANYVPDWAGFKIENNGNAEFNDVNVRGEIRSAVFKYDEVSAVAGTLGVFKSSGTLLENVIVTPGMSPFTIKTSLPYFELGDIIRIKDVYKKDVWASISGSGVFSGSQIDYTCELESISSGSYEFSAGTSILDYGTYNSGFLYMEANDNTTSGSPSGALGPYYSVRTTGSAPWNGTGAEVIRLGSLGGVSTGIDLDGQYGIAMGSSSGSMGYLTYDPAHGLRIKGQIVITSGSDTAEDRSTPNIIYAAIMPHNPIEGDYWAIPSGSVASVPMYQFSSDPLVWQYSGSLVTQASEPEDGSGGTFWGTESTSTDISIWTGSEWQAITGSRVYRDGIAPTVDDVKAGDFWINTTPYTMDDGTQILINTMHTYDLGGNWLPLIPGNIGELSDSIDALETTDSLIEDIANSKTQTYIGARPYMHNDFSTYIIRDIDSTGSPTSSMVYWSEDSGSLIISSASPVERTSGSPLVSGDFWTTGSETSASVAMWTSSAWHELNGLDGSASVIRGSGSTIETVNDGDYWIPTSSSLVFVAYKRDILNGDVYYDMSGSKVYTISMPALTGASIVDLIIDTPAEHYTYMNKLIGNVWYNTSIDSNNLNIYTKEEYPYGSTLSNAEVIRYYFKPVTTPTAIEEAILAKTATYYSSSSPVLANNGDLWINDGIIHKYNNGSWEEINLSYLTSADKAELEALVLSASNDNIITTEEKEGLSQLYVAILSEGSYVGNNLRNQYLSLYAKIPEDNTLKSSASDIYVAYSTAYGDFISDTISGSNLNDILITYASIDSDLGTGGKADWDTHWNSYNDDRDNLVNTMITMSSLTSTWDAISDKIESLKNPYTNMVTGLYLTANEVGFFNKDVGQYGEFVSKMDKAGNFHLGGNPATGGTGLDWAVDNSTGSTTGTSGCLTLGNANINIYDGPTNKVISLSSENQSLAIGNNVEYNANAGIWMGRIPETDRYGFKVGDNNAGIKWSGDKLEIVGGELQLGGSSGSPTLHLWPGDLSASGATRFPYISMGTPPPNSYNDANNPGLWIGRDPESSNKALSYFENSGSGILTAGDSELESGSIVFAIDTPRYTFRVGDFGGTYFGWSGSQITLKNASFISVDNTGLFYFRSTEIIDFASSPGEAIYGPLQSSYSGSNVVPMTNESGRLDNAWLDDRKTISLDIIYWDDFVTPSTTEYKGFWTVPDELNGYVVNSVNIAVKTASTTGSVVANVWSFPANDHDNYTRVASDSTIVTGNYTSYGNGGVGNFTLVARDVLGFWVDSSQGDAKGLQFIIVVDKPPLA